MDKLKIVYFGMDFGSEDRTIYYIYDHGEVKEINKEEYEQRISNTSKTTRQIFNN